MFCFPLLKCECICASYIRAFDQADRKPVPEPAFNVLRKEQQTEPRTSWSAPAGMFESRPGSERCMFDVQDR